MTLTLPCSDACHGHARADSERWDVDAHDATTAKPDVDAAGGRDGHGAAGMRSHCGESTCALGAVAGASCGEAVAMQYGAMPMGVQQPYGMMPHGMMPQQVCTRQRGHCGVCACMIV